MVAVSGWEETLASYEQTAALYAHSQWGTRLTRQMDNFETGLSGRLVCDLGCGPGRDVEWLTERGHSVVGIDLSPAMLWEARRRLPKALLTLGDARDLPLLTCRWTVCGRARLSCIWTGSAPLERWVRSPGSCDLAARSTLGSSAATSLSGVLTQAADGAGSISGNPTPSPPRCKQAALK
jgi:SAM-dependent methyltransferase